MNPEFSRILDQQGRWAVQNDLDAGTSRLTPDLGANLFRLPAEATLAELAASRRHPLGDAGAPGARARKMEGDRAKPGELQLLESTLALVCNVFEPARDAAGALVLACGGDPRAGAPRFCVPLEADALRCELDLLFDSPSLDAASSGSPSSGSDPMPVAPAGRPTALSATYTEPYRSARPRHEPANRVPSEWLETPRVWEALPMCRRLALDLRATPRRFEHVAAAELLAAGTCLTARYGYRGFRLVHLWYDAGHTSAAKYRGELDRFRIRVGGEIDFRAMTWQQLFAALAASEALEPPHLQYLQRRYALG